MSLAIVNLLPGPVQVLQYIDTEMALDTLKRFSRLSHLWKAKEIGTEIGGKSSQVVKQVWHLWKKIHREGLSRKGLTPQHRTDKVSTRPKGSPCLSEKPRIGEGPTLVIVPCFPIGWYQPGETMASRCRLWNYTLQQRVLLSSAPPLPPCQTNFWKN